MEQVSRNILLFYALFSICANGVELKITDFRPPSVQAYGLNSSLAGNSYYSEYGFGFEILPYYHFFNDSRQMNSKVAIEVSTNEFSFFRIHLLPRFDLRNYINSSAMFLNFEACVNSYFDRVISQQSNNWKKSTEADVTLGCGVGRLREGRFVAIALEINNILKKENIIDGDLTNETILAIAKILSKETFFRYSHERYQKDLYEEIERILQGDPNCQRPIPVFVWLKIIEIATETPFYWASYDYKKWSRMFGSRLSFDFSANEIEWHYWGYPKLKFPFFDSLDYYPIIGVKYEYEYPVNLRNQISADLSYDVEFNNSLSTHDIGTYCSYGHGIADFLLIRVSAEADYFFYVTQDVDSAGYFKLSPSASLVYFIEDKISFDLEFTFDFLINRNIMISDGDSTAMYYRLNFGVDWRIF